MLSVFVSDWCSSEPRGQAAPERTQIPSGKTVEKQWKNSGKTVEKCSKAIKKQAKNLHK